MKSKFVTMASHEFRTPLATMQLTADTLDAYWGRIPEEDIRKKLTRIRNNIQFLKNIVEKTMNLARFDSGKFKFSPQKTELNSFIKHILNNLKNSPDSQVLNFQGNRATFVFKY